MLVLKMHFGEIVNIGKDIRVIIDEHSKSIVKVMIDAPKEIKITRGSIPRRLKMIPGELVPDQDEVTLAEVQVKFKEVEEALGLEYLGKILDRIPAAGIASIKKNEFSRAIRLCTYFLDKYRLPKS